MLMPLWLHLILSVLTAVGRGSVLETTSTRTVIVIETVSHTLVALGGIIQNVQVRLENGDGNPWIYTTRLITGENVITIIPLMRTAVETIYLFGESTVTVSSTLLPDLAVKNSGHPISALPPLKLSKINPLKNEIEALIANALKIASASAQ